jgi:hypothetical protein
VNMSRYFNSLSWELGVGSWELGVGSWELGVGKMPALLPSTLYPLPTQTTSK